MDCKRVLARCPGVSKHHRPVLMWPLFSVGMVPFRWSLTFEHLLLRLQSSEEKSNWEKVVTSPPFTSSNISNEFPAWRNRILRAPSGPRGCCSTKTCKDGSKQQLSQEALNTMSQFQIHHFFLLPWKAWLSYSSPGWLGNSWWRFLLVSPCLVSLPHGRQEKAIHPLMECLLANTKGEVGSTTKPGCFQMPESSGGPSAAPTPAVGSNKRAKLTAKKASLLSPFLFYNLTSFISHDIHDCRLDFWREEKKRELISLKTSSALFLSPRSP